MAKEFTEKDFSFIKKMEVAASLNSKVKYKDIKRLKKISWNISTLLQDIIKGDERERLFFVVDNFDSNEEIFTTFQEASLYRDSIANKKDKGRIRVAWVRHSYQDKDGGWNYDDLPDTFDFIKEIE